MSYISFREIFIYVWFAEVLSGRFLEFVVVFGFEMFIMGFGVVCSICGGLGGDVRLCFGDKLVFFLFRLV